MNIFPHPLTRRFRASLILSFIWCLPAFAFAWPAQVGATSLWLNGACPLALFCYHITFYIKERQSPTRSNIISTWHSNISLALLFAITSIWATGFLISLIESSLLLKSYQNEGFEMEDLLWKSILEVGTCAVGVVLVGMFLVNTTVEQRKEARRQNYQLEGQQQQQQDSVPQAAWISN